MFLIRLDIKNRKVREDFEEVISSFRDFSTVEAAHRSPCDLLVLEITEEEIEFPHAFGAAREFFLTSPSMRSDILIEAMRAGAKEFISQPVNKEELKDAFQRFLDRKGKEDGRGFNKKGKVIDVVGTKGGVGATTVAVNLAAALKEAVGPKKVALVDMIPFGEISLFLEKTPAFDWGDAAKNFSRLDSTYLNGILSRNPSGVQILSSPRSLNGARRATPEFVEKLLALMRSEFDYIVIDSGHSFDSGAIKMLELSDIVFLVSELTIPCLVNMKKLMEGFVDLGYPDQKRLKLVVNRFHKKSAISIKEAEEGVQKKVSWVIPNDYQTAISAINQGKTLSSDGPGKEISRSFRELVSDFLKNDGRAQSAGNPAKAPSATRRGGFRDLVSTFFQGEKGIK